MEIHVPKEIYRIQVTDANRKIITSSSIFGILFDQLKKNIGENRVKSFLFHFGWEMGINDGKEALKQNLPIDALIKYGPRLHIKNGHIAGINHQCKVQLDHNDNVTSVLGQGVWIESYEAREYRKIQGISDTPVCHTLVGYSSGYMSTILKKTLLAKELTCVGRGDSECSWVIKTKEEWESENEEDLHFFKDQTIINELSYTYEQLLEQQKFLEGLADFQKQLTEEIVGGSDLEKVANRAFELIRIPITIENRDSEKITYAGLTDEQYTMLKEDLDESMKDSKSIHVNHKEKGESITTDIQKRLAFPIIVQQRIIGYCSFIYTNEKNIDFEKDYLLLERFSNAISLIHLNEKTKFESFERMKGNFLERIIDGNLPKAEMVKRGNYTGVDLTNPYYIMVMDYQLNHHSIEEEFQLDEQIYETTTYYFKERNQHILAGHHEGKLTVYISIDQLKEHQAAKLFTDFYQYLQRKYKKNEFALGISNIADDIKQITKYVEEATIALGLSADSGLTFFNNLGILGVLISSKNKQAIKLLAEKELGPLLDEKNADELIRTLYLYLLNGGKLEKTTSDLTLSMGGLRHRISKIEDLLNRDLRNPNDMHEILLILQSLIALGEWRLN
ncbi:helix-turn-helix domain-containing protein [Oceanobacillus rekensis]|uniref:helix-turn-helix domain-containing protein n=1 Tax=Oceanobacillus rekensis TaxID=937927 RepID=UPI000B447A03|nr:helix-turn-helix domain-containing protein [Oceanobacillus rekensis]